MPKTYLLVLALFLSAFVASRADTIDPWLFSGRSSLWDTLINNTTVPQMGPVTKSNWLIGFKMQFQWQYSSGRLQNNGDSISPTSWWGDSLTPVSAMNYYLTVPPYLAAADFNLVPQVNIRPPSTNADKFCTTLQACDDTLMAHWLEAMSSIYYIKQGGDMSVDELVTKFWKAHTYTIYYSLSHFEPEADMLPSQERRFGHGWALFVEMIAATNFKTNYTNVASSQVFLPQRVLKATDIPPFISDMSAGTNAMVGSMIAVHLLDKVGGYAPLLSVWEKVMQKPQCQEVGRYVITNFLNNPVDSLIEVIKGVITACNNNNYQALMRQVKFNHVLIN